MDSRRTLQSIPGGDSFLGEKGPTDVSLLAAVLPYVLLIIFLPITVFFTSKSYLFEDILGYSDTTANVYSAACAIIILHILLAMFIIKSFKDSQPKDTKQD